MQNVFFEILKKFLNRKIQNAEKKLKIQTVGNHIMEISVKIWKFLQKFGNFCKNLEIFEKNWKFLQKFGNFFKNLGKNSILKINVEIFENQVEISIQNWKTKN